MKIVPIAVTKISQKVVGVISPKFAKIHTWSIYTRLIWGIFAGFSIIFAAFQKKLLPIGLSAIVSKVAFYPTFPFTALRAAGNYMTDVDDTLILGCAPFECLGHPKKLHNMGVRGVVNMCLEYEGPIQSYDNLGIMQLRLPTTDHYHSSPSQLQDAVKFIELHQKRGEKVYVHCKAGHGRAAAVALCWMAYQHPEIPPSTLNAALFGKRRVRKKLFRQANVIECINSFKEDTKK